MFYLVKFCTDCYTCIIENIIHIVIVQHIVHIIYNSNLTVFGHTFFSINTLNNIS